MNNIIEIDGMKLVPEVLIEPKKREFISQSFLEELLKPDNIETYRQILETLEFKYMKKKGRENPGFGEKDVNKNVTKLIGTILSDFLEKPDNIETITDKVALSESQVSATYAVLANAHARLEHSNTDLFVTSWDMKRLVRNKYFTDSLSKDIIITPMYGAKREIKKYFTDMQHLKTDLIYSKINLRPTKQELIKEQEKNNKKAEIPKEQTLRIIFLPSPKRETKLEDEIYKQMPKLEERKKQGNKLATQEAREYLTKLNRVTGNKILNQDFIKFISTEQGKKFLEHKGQPTDRFMKYINTNQETILEKYKT